MMLNSLSRVADARRDGDVLDVGLVVQALERGLRARARTSSVMFVRFVQVAARAPRSRRSGSADGRAVGPARAWNAAIGVRRQLKQNMTYSSRLRKSGLITSMQVTV